LLIVRYLFGLRVVTIPVTSRTLGGNEHVPEDKQGVAVSRIGLWAWCLDRLELAE
jgi:hypothetical protein